MKEAFKNFLSLAGIEQTNPTIPVIQVHAMFNFLAALNNLTMYQILKNGYTLDDPNLAEDWALAEANAWQIIPYLGAANDRQMARVFLFISQYEGIDIQKVQTRFFDAQKNEG